MKFKLIFCLCVVSVISHAQSGLLSPSGISFPAFTTSSRPAANSVGIGTVLYNTTDNTHQYSNGSSWLNLSGTNTLPSGTANQTLRNNGSGWIADGLMKNDGTKIQIGNSVDFGYALLNVYANNNAPAIFAHSTNLGDGVSANSDFGRAVYGATISGVGVGGFASAPQGVGVFGSAPDGIGVQGFSLNSYGGIFVGRLRLKKNNFGDAGIFFDNSSGNNVGYVGMFGDNELMVWGNGVAIQRWNVNNLAICHATSPTICSDIRLKKDFRNLSNSLTSINQLKGYHYYLRNEKNKNLQTGFIAQEIQKIFPELVQTDTDGYLSVDYTGLIPHLVEAVKELKAENEKWKMMNEESRASNNELSGRLGKLEERLIQIEVLLQSKIGDK
ncbi:tail fiber domain-containing protein [Runella sp. SP2]|uniref:tail fiber domain-containing protein n=1 Tax=Runella sp. SP2 TaxID=2268026 RepID=UPI000F08E6BB|nr:tail fiber domain-containing protein [Runella sp. SP2]AYQ32205.1 tail fiber domain-containing protein [Runella sp. SP2]